MVAARRGSGHGSEVDVVAEVVKLVDEVGRVGTGAVLRRTAVRVVGFVSTVAPRTARQRTSPVLSPVPSEISGVQRWQERSVYERCEFVAVVVTLVVLTRAFLGFGQQGPDWQRAAAGSMLSPDRLLVFLAATVFCARHFASLVKVFTHGLLLTSSSSFRPCRGCGPSIPALLLELRSPSWSPPPSAHFWARGSPSSSSCD